MLIRMRIYRYRIGPSIYYGEQVSADILRRMVCLGRDLFQLKLAGPEDRLDEVELLAPCNPSKIICVGRNYREHAAEMGNAVPEERPLLFFKPPSCLIGHGQAIVMPRGCERVDFEAEIALVIGKQCCKVDASEAYDYLLGVTAFNDVTERSWQKRDSQWSVAKGCDTFGPCGPYIDTSAAEALRLGGDRRVPLAVSCYVNGQQRQHGSSADLTFNFASLISYASQYFTLEAGDLIVTGTPAGVGQLNAGDEVVVELNCGPRLVNSVIAAE